MAILDAQIRRGLRYLAPYKRRLAVILTINLAGTALALYIPFLTRSLVDDALLGQDTDCQREHRRPFAAVTWPAARVNFVSGMS